MKRLLFAAALLAALPAHAQQPEPPRPPENKPDYQAAAVAQTFGETLQAYLATRAALMQAQAELATAKSRITELESKAQK